MDPIVQDLRGTIRAWRKDPGFALGIGANTAIFSVVSAVPLRSPAFLNQENLVRLYETQHRDRKQDGKLFDGMIAYSTSNRDL